MHHVEILPIMLAATVSDRFLPVKLFLQKVRRPGSEIAKKNCWQQPAKNLCISYSFVNGIKKHEDDQQPQKMF